MATDASHDGQLSRKDLHIASYSYLSYTTSRFVYRTYEKRGSHLAMSSSFKCRVRLTDAQRRLAWALRMFLLPGKIGLAVLVLYDAISVLYPDLGLSGLSDSERYADLYLLLIPGVSLALLWRQVKPICETAKKAELIRELTEEQLLCVRTASHLLRALPGGIQVKHFSGLDPRYLERIQEAVGE